MYNNSRAFRNRMKVTENDDKEKHYHYKSKQIKRKLKKAKAEKKRKYTGRILSLLMAGIVLIGGYNIYKANEPKPETTMTLKQALKSGKNLEDLGIDESIIRRINEIQDKLDNKKLSNSELIALSTKIYLLQYDVLTTKLSNVLNLDENKIKIDIKEVEPCEKVQLIRAGDETYTNAKFFKSGNTISKGVEEYIYDILETKDFMVNIQQENLNREDIYSYCQSSIECIDKFAATKMYVDNEGNILMENEIKKDSNSKEYYNEER